MLNLVNGMKFEDSVMHQVAKKYELLTGLEVTVVGGSVVDTAFGIQPNDFDLYIQVPVDCDDTYRFVEFLVSKNAIHFAGNYDVPGIIGHCHTSLGKIDIIIHHLPVHEYVDQYFDIDLKTMTYDVREGLFVSSAAQKALDSNSVSFHLNSSPTSKEKERLLCASSRYNMESSDKLVDLADALVSPFGLASFFYTSVFESELLEHQSCVDSLVSSLRGLGYTFRDFQQMKLLQQYNAYSVYTSSDEFYIAQFSFNGRFDFMPLTYARKHLPVYNYKVSYPVAVSNVSYSSYGKTSQYVALSDSFKKLLLKLDDQQELEIMFTNRTGSKECIHQVDTGLVQCEGFESVSRGESSWTIYRYQVSFTSGRKPLFIEYVSGWAGKDRGGSDDFQRQQYYVVSRDYYRALDRW